MAFRPAEYMFAYEISYLIEAGELSPCDAECLCTCMHLVAGQPCLIAYNVSCGLITHLALSRHCC